MTRAMKVSAKKWAGAIAEEGLSSITSGVGRFTVRVIKRMVTSIKKKNSSRITRYDFMLARVGISFSFPIYVWPYGRLMDAQLRERGSRPLSVHSSFYSAFGGYGKAIVSFGSFSGHLLRSVKRRSFGVVLCVRPM